MPPNTRTTLRFFIFFISSARNILQLCTSSDVGKFFGGTHFTEFVILTDFNFNQSLMCDLYLFSAKPNFDNDENKTSPAKSPVKGLPVAFAPFKPGASPNIKILEFISPNDGTGLLNQ